MLQNKEWWDKYSQQATSFFVWVTLTDPHSEATKGMLHTSSQEITREQAVALVEPAFKQYEKLKLFINGPEMFIG